MSRKLVSYRLAEDLQQALKTRAGSEGISATELVNRLLRQGLAAGSDDPLQRRVSQLEQVLHQLERQVMGGHGLPEAVPEAALAAAGSPEALSATALTARLLALEHKIDRLSTGMEEGCRSLQQIDRRVQGLAAHGRAADGLTASELTEAATYPGLQVSTPAHPGDLAQDVVQMPLAALRKLLGAGSSE
ncbi:MAG TPA: hypothetical protein VLS96_13065 [Nodosilinea sp.]|nr:hypothetical protein [Nodosilinea sp.]